MTPKQKYKQIMFLACIGLSVQAEDILIKAKKPKSESVSKIKEEIAIDLEELLNLSTRTMRHLAELIDDIVLDVKQLTGQESGVLASADKKKLEEYRLQLKRAKEAIKLIESQCCLAT